MKHLLAILACIPFLFPAPALAATRRCNAVVIRGHHVQHQVVLQQFAQPYAYQVGAGIQQDALAERVASLVLQKLVTQQGSVQQQGGPAEQPVQPTKVSYLSSCVRCHNADNAKGGFDITGELSCEERLEAVRRMLLPPGHPERMPKGVELTPDQLGNALGELTGALEETNQGE